MNKKSKRVALLGAVFAIIFFSRYAIVAEFLIWNEIYGEQVAFSTNNESLLYAIINKSTRINAKSQYQLIDKCYVSLGRIYKGKSVVNLDSENFRLLKRAFTCHLAMGYSSEAEMESARIEHQSLLTKIHVK